MCSFLKFYFFYNWGRTNSWGSNKYLFYTFIFFKFFISGRMLISSPMLAPWNHIVSLDLFLMFNEYFSKNLFVSSFPIIILAIITNGEMTKKIVLIILYRRNINYFWFVFHINSYKGLTLLVALHVYPMLLLYLYQSHKYFQN